PGAAGLTINGNNIDRVFLVGRIWSPDPSLVVALSGLTVTGGNAVSGSNSCGGGLLNFGTLTVNNCTFTGNAAAGGQGGGLVNSSTSTTTPSVVSNSTFAGNSA